ncbi:MAG TPA: PAS domain-containing protein [Afipia sp.]
MSDADFRLYGIRDPRLAVHATSGTPAWLWSADGAHILWANAAGARLFGARNAALLAEKAIGPADPHRRQAAQLASRLTAGATRLERLRGFGAPLGRLLTCACTRLSFPDGTSGLLIVAAEPAGRPVPLTERLAPVIDSVTAPAMMFTVHGSLTGMNEPGKNYAGLFNDLTGPGFDEARNAALRDGQSMLKTDFGRVAVHRIGSGADVMLVALIGAATAPKQKAKQMPEVILEPAPPTPAAESVNIPPAAEPPAAVAAAPPSVPVDAVPDEATPDLLADVLLADDIDTDIAPSETFESAFDETVSATEPSAPPEMPATDQKIADHTVDEPASSMLTTPEGERPAGMQDNSPNPESEPAVDTPQNVVPFPLAPEPKSPALTAGESNAFDELARRLSARLEGEIETEAAQAETSSDVVTADTAIPEIEIPSALATEYPAAYPRREASPPRAASAQDPQLLDRLPTGVLIYRLDRLLYANSAFLASTGYETLHALTEAGGLDALIVEAGAGSASSTSETGTPVVIATTSENGPEKGQPADARLFAISWDGEPAHALVFSGARAEPRIETVPAVAATPAVAPNDDTTRAEELSTILDATSEGIVVFNDQGRLESCNRGAEILFGRDDREIAALNLIDLFMPESQRAVLEYLEGVKGAAVASLLEHGREALGRARDGSAIPLSMTLGRTGRDSGRFFATLRDQSQIKKSEAELLQARRQADRSMNARADILGRISHEVRMPLNAIIGFADVMITERFGALGNERYAEYLKDIRASGERVMAIIDDLLDLSRIEAGKMEMTLTNQDLNSMVEQCVAVMQPHANRERIIIRTSLAHALPNVKADARALRQIALNLIGNSIHLANAGGQVIVSTATTDFGDIVLRVRDTGPGLNDNEIAAAMEPFRTAGASDQTADSSAASLSLTKALVEANRAKFHIKTAPHSGTLIEVVFSHASAIA